MERLTRTWATWLPTASTLCVLAMLVWSWFPMGCGQGSVDDPPPVYDLKFRVQPPARVTTGIPMAPAVQVGIVDSSGIVQTDKQVAITLALKPGTATGTLSGTLTRSTSQGIATFDDLKMSAAGTGYKLVASATDYDNVDSNAFDDVRALSFALQPASLASSTEPNSQTIASADFNGDSRDDLVTVNAATYQVLVFLSKGDGTFQDPLPYSTDIVPFAVTVADATGDGKMDIIVVGGGGVAILPGNGDGTFGPRSIIPTGTEISQLRGICTGRFASSGLLDIAVTDAVDNSIYVLRNDGAGAFTVQNFPSGGALSNPRTIVACDLDGDGIPDLAVANSDRPGQTVWRNAGGSTLDVLFPPGNATNVNLANSTGSCLTILAADFNSDLRADVFGPDIVQLSGQAQGNYFANQGAGGFATPVIYSIGQNSQGSAGADFNLDGFLDVGIATVLGLTGTTGDLEVLLGNGDGTLQAVQAFPLATGLTQSCSMAVGDFNYDGLPDVAVSNGPTWIFLNTSR